MQNLYFAYEQEPASDSLPEKETLLEYRDMVKGIRDHLKPEMELEKIDENIINIFVKDLRLALKDIEGKIKDDIDYTFVGLDTIYSLLVQAVTQLNVALKASEEIRRKGFDAKVMTQLFDCLQTCRQYLDETLQGFSSLLP